MMKREGRQHLSDKMASDRTTVLGSDGAEERSITLSRKKQATIHVI